MKHNPLETFRNLYQERNQTRTFGNWIEFKSENQIFIILASYNVKTCKTSLQSPSARYCIVSADKQLLSNK